MNAAELAGNAMADDWSVADLNREAVLPYDDAAFDAVTCCVSVDYLTRPLEVFAEVARVLRPGGLFVCTFSNRCFPTKAIRGWLSTDDRGRCTIVATYFELTDGFDRNRHSSTATRAHAATRSTPCGPGESATTTETLARSARLDGRADEPVADVQPAEAPVLLVDLDRVERAVAQESQPCPVPSDIR